MRAVIGITAAMPDGTKLSKFAKQFPERFFDVGIAEAHAVCFAAGAATTGLKPVCAIYSTFLQRAYDQVVHDVCVQNLPVVFCMDRAGLVGDDGPTHMGLYDIAYMRTLPNMTVMAPRNEDEMLPMLEHALEPKRAGRRSAIRAARRAARHRDAPAPIEQGKAEVLRRGSGVAILALGNTVDVALDAYDLLASGEFGRSDRLPTVVNARFAKPVDEALLEELAKIIRLILTLGRTFARRRLRLGGRRGGVGPATAASASSGSASATCSCSTTRSPANARSSASRRKRLPNALPARLARRTLP